MDYLDIRFIGPLTEDQAYEALLQSKIECYINVYKSYHGFKPKMVIDDEYGISCWEVDELMDRLQYRIETANWDNLSQRERNELAMAQYNEPTPQNVELTHKLLVALSNQP